MKVSKELELAILAQSNQVIELKVPTHKSQLGPTNGFKLVCARCVAVDIPAPVPEYRFHPVRGWRFDLAWPENKIALEIDGGLWIDGGGAHNRGEGYERDRERDAEAMLLGWKVFRCSPAQLSDWTAIWWIRRAIKGDA